MNTAELDIAYKAFLTVRQEWMSTLRKFARYPTDTSSDDFVRPVAVIGGDRESAVILNRLEHLLVEWQRFYTLAESYRAKKISPIPFTMYAPIPFIAPEHDFAVVVINAGANTTKLYVEKVLSIIDKKISINMRAMGMSNTQAKKEMIEDELLLLNADRLRFMKFPPSTLFVRRGNGYTDVKLKLKDEAALEDVNTPASIFDGFVDRDAHRVGQYGCVVRSDALKYELLITDNQSRRTSYAGNIYNSITPVPCSAFASNVSLYLSTDVEESRVRAARLASEKKLHMTHVYASRTKKRRAEKMGKERAEIIRPHGERRKNLSELATPIKKQHK